MKASTTLQICAGTEAKEGTPICPRSVSHCQLASKPNCPHCAGPLTSQVPPATAQAALLFNGFCSLHAGDSERKVKKAAKATGADCICLDLEDAVAQSQKAAARDTVATALASM